MAYIHSFESFGTIDGPGIRFIVFLQGCPLRCKYCHNRDTWEVGGSDLQEEAADTFKRILKYRSYIASGGVTVSGGESLFQPDYIFELFTLCKKKGIHTAVDTSGYILNNAVKRALTVTDLVLLDIKAIDPEIHLDLTSVPLKPVLKFAEYLKSINMPVWIRHVVVPTITYNDDLLKKTAEYLTQFKNIEKVELLAYHTMGVHKWENMGKKYSLEGIPALSREEFKHAKEIFASFDLPM